MQRILWFGLITLIALFLVNPSYWLSWQFQFTFMAGLTLASCLLPIALIVLSFWIRSLVFWRMTYLFWALFSFFYSYLSVLFSYLLMILICPALVFLVLPYYSQFWPFLVIPLARSVMVASLLGAWINFRNRLRQWPYFLEIFPLIFNLTLLVSFVIFVEQHRQVMMSHALSAYKPDCVVTHTFLESLHHAETASSFAHAYFVEAGKTYFWSYAQQRFVVGHDTRQCPAKEAERPIYIAGIPAFLPEMSITIDK